MGMAQVLAAVAYGIKGVRRGQTIWQWPDFDPDPERENQAQMARWSINVAPNWKFPPLAITNQYRNRETGPQREIIFLPGIYFFDGWQVQPSLTIPADLPQTRDVPDKGTPRANAADRKENPDRQKMKQGIFSQRHTRTKWKTAQTHDEQPSEHANTSKCWRQVWKSHP